MPRIALPKDVAHPIVACTPTELGRLRKAYKGSSPAREIVAAVVSRADRARKAQLEFPPRGGQHNQWYQCEKCQVALKTVDDTHHRCPTCGKVYTGEPYDDVIYERKHYANLRKMTDAAWAHAITGKQAYAELAAKVLLGYAERYRKYPYHTASRRKGRSRSGGHLFEQTLNEAAALARQIAPAYDLIHDALAPEQREAIRTGLIVPMLENMDKNKGGKGNWQTWHNAGMLWGGAAIGDVSWVRKALTDPKNGFAYQMQVSVSDEGMWYENSWGYHFYTLQGMTAITEGARRLGIDLWGHPEFKKMFTLAGRYAMADGSLPRFGDDVRSSAGMAANLMECAYHAYRDPGIGELLPEQPVWETVLLGRGRAGQRKRTPPQGSEVFPGAGHAILRTRGKAGLTAAMTFGPYGGFHGHFDKLSFVFFGCGKELGVDPGRAASQAYRLPVHKQWYKATLGHNAVLVDAASQQPACGKLELFSATDTHAAVIASCDAAYPGVRHQRLLCMMPTYVLVFDGLTSDRVRRFDWVYHNRGSSVRCEAASRPGKLARSYPGQEYVRNVRIGTTDGPVHVSFADKDVTTHLTVAAQPKTEVRIGDGVGASVLDRVPLVMVTRRGQGARFAAVIEPIAGGGKPGVESLEVERTPEGIQMTVRKGKQTDTLTLTEGNKLTVRSGGKTVLTGKP